MDYGGLWMSKIRWLKEHQRFIVFHAMVTSQQQVVLLDSNGVKLAEYNIKGVIVGVDETKDGFNIFFALENRGPSQLMLTQLDDSLVERLTTKLPIVDRSQTIYSCRLGISILSIAQSQVWRSDEVL